MDHYMECLGEGCIEYAPDRSSTRCNVCLVSHVGNSRLHFNMSNTYARSNRIHNLEASFGKYWCSVFTSACVPYFVITVIGFCTHTKEQMH